MGNQPSSSASSSKRRSSSRPETTAERVKKVVGEVQEEIKRSVKKLDDDHPAAQLIDTVCGTSFFDDDASRGYRSGGRSSSFTAKTTTVRMDPERFRKMILTMIVPGAAVLIKVSNLSRILVSPITILINVTNPEVDERFPIVLIQKMRVVWILLQVAVLPCKSSHWRLALPSAVISPRQELVARLNTTKDSLSRAMLC